MSIEKFIKVILIRIAAPPGGPSQDAINNSFTNFSLEKQPETSTCVFYFMMDGYLVVYFLSHLNLQANAPFYGELMDLETNIFPICRFDKLGPLVNVFKKVVEKRDEHGSV